LGNLGDCQSVGNGVFELRIDYGSGFRIYFGQIGMTIVILICGGDKSTQDRDIAKLKNTGQIIGVKTMPKSLPYHPFLIESLKKSPN
jgi:putative addiction module killer protein